MPTDLLYLARCRHCRGTGDDARTPGAICPACDGRRLVRADRFSAHFIASFTPYRLFPATVPGACDRCGADAAWMLRGKLARVWSWRCGACAAALVESGRGVYSSAP